MRGLESIRELREPFLNFSKLIGAEDSRMALHFWLIALLLLSHRALVHRGTESSDKTRQQTQFRGQIRRLTPHGVPDLL